jgi:hypothetical protein
VLRQATRNAQSSKGPGTSLPESDDWAAKANGVCGRQSRALQKLGTPRNLDEIAAYAERALPIVRRFHARFATIQPPGELVGGARHARRWLRKQELGLQRVRAAARSGDSTATLSAVDSLRSLARNANPDLVRLRLTECTLPSWGLPL